MNYYRCYFINLLLIFLFVDSGTKTHGHQLIPQARGEIRLSGRGGGEFQISSKITTKCAIFLFFVVV